MVKKLILPPKHQKNIEVSDHIPSTDLLLHDAKLIIASELAHYRSKISRGSNLDLKEARVIQGYLDTLTKLQREEREAARQHDLSNLSDEELLQLANDVFSKTKALPEK